MRITPEPTDDERRLILAALERRDGDAEGVGAESNWRWAALRDHADVEPGHDSEPSL